MKRIVYALILFNVILATVAVCITLMKREEAQHQEPPRADTIVHDTVQLTDRDRTERYDRQKDSYQDHHSVGISSAKSVSIAPVDLQKMTRQHPFFQEAAKVLSGKLNVDDAECRTMILNYCEHFRSAYDTKDLDFIRQVFSENALIIVGKVVKSGEGATGYLNQERVEYNVRSKKEYLAHLSKAFSENKKIRVQFSSFRIMRHPTEDGIYGVTLRQKYESDTYNDDGYLFLLWDFSNASMPKIHVRTWQQAKDLKDEDDVLGIGDFYLR